MQTAIGCGCRTPRRPCCTTTEAWHSSRGSCSTSPQRKRSRGAGPGRRGALSGTIVEHTPVITLPGVPRPLAVRRRPRRPPTSARRSSSCSATHAAQWSEPGFWTQVVHPDDLRAVLAETQRTAETGEPYRQEYRMVAADGRTVWFHDESASDPRRATGNPLVVAGRHGRHHRADGGRGATPPGAGTPPSADRPHPGGRLRGGAGRRPDEVLPQPAGRADLRLHGRGVDLDARLLGRSRPPRRPRGGRGAYDAAARIARIDAILAEYRFRRADGTYVWVHDEAVLRPDHRRRRLLAGLPVRRDGAEGGRGAAVEAERLFRATVEHLPAVVYREALGPRACTSSTSARRSRSVFGYTARGVVAGLRVLGRPHPPRRRRAGRRREPSTRTRRGSASRQDYRFRHADGRYVWVHDEATFVGDAARGAGGRAS